MEYIKYPRTEHLLGSKFLDQSNFNTHYVNNEQFCFPSLTSTQLFVIEEKMDGIGIGIFFIGDSIHFQQRGHIFNIDNIPDLLKKFKTWALLNEELLFCIVANQYTLFGEWLEFKHTVFYNNLPDFFLEYDIYDHTTQKFLSTNQRYSLINNQLHSVKVLKQTHSLSLEIIHNLLTEYPTSYFNNNSWSDDFNYLCKNLPSLAFDTTKNSSYEGFYIKIEDKEKTLSRMKWIRKEFFDIVKLNEHWKNKQIVTNIKSQI